MESSVIDIAAEFLQRRMTALEDELKHLKLKVEEGEKIWKPLFEMWIVDNLEDNLQSFIKNKSWDAGGVVPDRADLNETDVIFEPSTLKEMPPIKNASKVSNLKIELEERRNDLLKDAVIVDLNAACEDFEIDLDSEMEEILKGFNEILTEEEEEKEIEKKEDHSESEYFSANEDLSSSDSDPERDLISIPFQKDHSQKCQKKLISSEIDLEARDESEYSESNRESEYCSEDEKKFSDLKSSSSISSVSTRLKKSFKKKQAPINWLLIGTYQNMDSFKANFDKRYWKKLNRKSSSEHIIEYFSCKKCPLKNPVKLKLRYISEKKKVQVFLSGAEHDHHPFKTFKKKPTKEIKPNEWILKETYPNMDSFKANFKREEWGKIRQRHLKHSETIDYYCRGCRKKCPVKMKLRYVSEDSKVDLFQTNAVHDHSITKQRSLKAYQVT